MVTSAVWLDRFQDALDRARIKIKYSREMIASGTTTNVDLVVHPGANELNALINLGTIDLDAPLVPVATTPDELLNAIVYYFRRGEGADIPVDAGTLAWLAEQVGGSPMIGGTSGQTVNTLTVLGMRTLGHIVSRSAEQIAVFDRPDRVFVATADGLTALTEALSTTDQTMYHLAIEYVTGMEIVVNRKQLTAPATSRIIVAFDPLNSAMQIDSRFADAVIDDANGIRVVMFSGYSQQYDPAEFERFTGESIELFRKWRAARPDLLIHVEFGTMPDAREFGRLVERIAPEVHSIGLNSDEIGDLRESWGGSPLKSQREMFDMLAAIRDRLPTPRICFHTASYAMTLTSGDPEQERDALLFGSLVASTRARIGRCPRYSELEETLNVAGAHPEGLRLIALLQVREGIVPVGDEHIVVVPSIEVLTHAGTVGLGDSFTAGTLVFL